MINSIQKILFVIFSSVSINCLAVSMNVNFKPTVQYETGGVSPNNIVTDDINNDGHMDAIIASEGRLHFLLGDGLGALKKDNSLRPSFFSSGYFVTGDFNKDGIRDLAVSQVSTSGFNDSFCGRKGGVLIYLGVGGEAPEFFFKHCVQRGYDSVFKSVATGDFNEDGNLDIVINGVVANLKSGMGVFYGNGDGTFSSSAIILGSNAKDIKVVDVNGDGHQDILSAGYAGSHLGNGDGSFTSISYGGDAGIDFGDVTGDGVADVIALHDDKVSFTSPTSFTQLRITSFDVNGNTIRTSRDLPGFVDGITIVDLNKDTFDDILVRFSGGNVQVYFSTGDGNLIEGPVINLIGDSTQNGTSLLINGDWNEDGFVDLAMASRFTLKEQDSMLWIATQVPVVFVDTELPIINLTFPVSGIPVANLVSLQATASDNISIIKVEFYIDGVLLGSSAGPVYATGWNTLTVPDGIHIVSAKAFDAAGNSATSTASIRVANAAPAITSSPSFDIIDAGVAYNYQLIVTGDTLLSYELITSPTGMRIDSVTGNISWIPDGTHLGSNAVTVRVTNANGVDEQSYSIIVVDTTAPSTPLNGHIVSKVPDVSATFVWDASNDVVGVIGYRIYKYYHRSQFNKGWGLIKDNITGLIATVAWREPFEPTNSRRFAVVAFDAAGNLSARSITIHLPSGSNTAPEVSLVTSSSQITLPTNTVTLTGSAIDDGLPNGSLSYFWKVRSGSRTVTFLSPYSAVTTARFSSAGHFELELTVQDGDSYSGAFVSIDVFAAAVVNQPPSITPMSNIIITLPVDTVDITAEIFDYDGLPARNLDYAWTVPGGPGVVSFTPQTGAVGSTNLVTTQVSFTVAGTYNLQISASDGALTTTAMQRVIVNPEPTTTPPVDLNSETMEIIGVITEVGTNFIIVNGLTIWIAPATIVKYEEFARLAVGFSVDCKVQPNVDGSVTAIKIQVQ